MRLDSTRLRRADVASRLHVVAAIVEGTDAGFSRAPREPEDVEGWDVDGASDPWDAALARFAFDANRTRRGVGGETWTRARGWQSDDGQEPDLTKH